MAGIYQLQDPIRSEQFKIFKSKIDKAILTHNEAVDLLHSYNKNVNVKTKAGIENTNALFFSKLKESISTIIDGFTLYLQQANADDLFLPQIELYTLSLISEQLYTLKTKNIKYYSATFSDGEIYLSNRINSLKAYIQSLKNSDATSSAIIHWQKNPIKYSDHLYKAKKKSKKLTQAQATFRTLYKAEIDRDEPNPLSEFSKKLKSNYIAHDVNNAQQPRSVNTDFELKDLYSLERVLSYLNLVDVINLNENPSDIYVLERVIQVVGEFLKSTEGSPHTSKKMEQKLITLKISLNELTSLRDRLSHPGNFHLINRENDKNLFTIIKNELKKIKPVMEKFLYNIELDNIKNMVKEIDTTHFTDFEINLIKKIEASENFNELITYLNNLKIDVAFSNVKNKEIIKNKLFVISTTINLKQPNEENIDLEENLNIYRTENSNKFKEFLEPYLIYRKGIYTKSQESSISTNVALKVFALDTNSIKSTLKEKEIFKLFIYKTFKEYTPLYLELTKTTGQFKLGVSKIIDLALLDAAILDFAEQESLSLSEKDPDLIEKFKLFNQLELRKEECLTFFQGIKYAKSIDDIIKEFSDKFEFNPKEKRLLKENMLILQQHLLQDYIFEQYFDSLLEEFKITTNKVNEYERVIKEIENKKEMHNAHRRLVAFANGEFHMMLSEYINVVNILNPNDKIKKELKANFYNKSELKKRLASLVNKYGSLIKSLKENESIKENSFAFSKFTYALDITQESKNQLNSLFKKNEIERMEYFFLEKLNKLEILAKYELSGPATSKKTSANLEMLLLDLTNIWRNISTVSHRKLKALDISAPLFQGLTLNPKFPLRNYLAHGDILFDTLNPHFISRIQKNVPNFIKEVKSLFAFKKLLDDEAMSTYLLEEIVLSKHISKLEPTKLPNHLQPFSDLLINFQNSLYWEDYLKVIDPSYTTLLEGIPHQIFSSEAIQTILENEFHEAAKKNEVTKLKYCLDNGVTDIYSALSRTPEADNSESFDFLKTFATKIDPSIAAQAIVQGNLALLESLAANNELQGNLLLHLAIVMDEKDAFDLILKNIPNIEEKDPAGFSPLLASLIASDSTHFALDLCRHNADVNAISRDGTSAAFLLTLKENLYLLKFLKLHYPTLILDRLNKAGWAPIHHAVSKNNSRFLTYFIQQEVDANLKGNSDLTPLHIAAQNGHIKCMDILFAAPGINLNAVDKNGYSVLVTAIIQKEYEAARKILDAAPGLINTIDNSGWFPIHHATFTNEPRFIELLIEKGVDVNQIASDMKMTSAHFAASRGYIEILDTLKINHADLTLKMENDLSSLDLAIIMNQHQTVTFLLAQNEVLPLINKSALNGFSPSHWASRNGHLAIFTILIEKEPNLINLVVQETHLSHLHLAAIKGHKPIIDYILDEFTDFNVNIQDFEDKTALHLAAQNGHSDIVKSLLQKGASISLTNVNGSTALALAAKNGHLDTVKTLIECGADVSAVVLLHATLSNDPELINFILDQIKNINSEALVKALNYQDINHFSPLMWAIGSQKTEAVKVLLQEADKAGIDILSHKNKLGNTPLAMAVNRPYRPIDRTNAESIKLSKQHLANWQATIDLLYLRTYKGSIPEEKLRILQDDFAKFVHLASTTYLSNLADPNEVVELHNRLEKEGRFALWDKIEVSVWEEMSKLHSDICLDPQTQEETPVLKDLMKTYPRALDKLALRRLSANKALIQYRELQKKAKIAVTKRCGSPGSNKRKREAICLNDVTEEQIKKIYDPFLAFDDEDHVTATLSITLAKPEQLNKINKNLAQLHEIYAEKRLSIMEKKKLDLFKKHGKELERINLYSVNDITQATLVKVSNAEGKSVYLSISRDNTQTISIYCSKLNGHHTLHFPNMDINEVLTLYTSLLFPETASNSLNYQSYTTSLQDEYVLNSMSWLALDVTDLRSDTKILADNHNLIEGLTMENFRELFLINGKIPEIEQIHINIFNDSEIGLSFLSTKLSEKLWQMSPEQQSALAHILNKYSIQIESFTIGETVLDFHTSLDQFNQRLIERLKRVTTNEPITHDELTNLSKEYLYTEFARQGFKTEEINKILSNVFDLHDGIKESFSNAVGMTRQGIFMAPAFIRALNGSPDELQAMTAMMMGDIALDHIYQSLINNSRFINRFSKAAGILSKSARFVASPIGKILLINSFFELHEQLKTTDPGSPEHELAKSLLIDNTILFALIVAEMLGLALGPAGIILDIGITIHQLLTSAKYYRDTLPFKVTFWQSVGLALGFEKTWLEENLLVNALIDRQLQEVNNLAKSGTFTSALIRVPEIIKTESFPIKFNEMPEELQKKIKANPLEAIDTWDIAYIPAHLGYIINGGYYSIDSAQVKKIRAIKKTLLTVLLKATTDPIFQDTKDFQRTRAACRVQEKMWLLSETVCRDVANIHQGYWQVGASTTTTSGEQFPGSPIQISGGAGALMLNNQSNLQEKRFFINFNSYFGGIEVTEVDFLQTYSAIVVVIENESLGKEKLFEPEKSSSLTPSFLALHNIPKSIQITYIVRDNDLLSHIEEKNLAAEIILSASYKTITFSTENDGTLSLGNNAPQFLFLDHKPKIAVVFNEDSSLSGPVALKTQSIILEKVKGQQDNPPKFLLNNTQSFTIGLLPGTTNYQLVGNFVLQVIVLDKSSDQIARISKYPNQNNFEFFTNQTLNKLIIINYGLISHLTIENSFDIKKFSPEITLQVHGQYSFKDQAYAATLKINHPKSNLILMRVENPLKLLKQKEFINTILNQKFSSVTLYDAITAKPISIDVDIRTQQITYQGILYQFDILHGLVAIKGRKLANIHQEDFANALTLIVVCADNTQKPYRIGRNALKCEDGREFINLKPDTEVLTPKGKFPLGLHLPIQQGDTIQFGEIAGLIGPTSKISHISLKSDAAGAANTLVIHHRADDRAKRDTTEQVIEVYFTKVDDVIPKNVELENTVFKIDFSELPLLSVDQKLIISHEQFNKIPNDLELHTEEINGKILVEVPGTQIIYRIENSQNNLEIVDTKTKKEKNLSITISETSNISWTFPFIGVAAVGIGIFNLNALRLRRAAGVNPVVAAVAGTLSSIPLLPKETLTAKANSLWQSASNLFNTEKMEASSQTKQPAANAAYFFRQAANDPFNSKKEIVTQLYMHSTKESSIDNVDYSQLDKNGLLLIDLGLKYLGFIRPNKSKAPCYFKENISFLESLEIANRIVADFKNEITKQTRNFSIGHEKIAEVFDFHSLSLQLTKNILANNEKALFATLQNVIPEIKKLNLIHSQRARVIEELESIIEVLVDKVAFPHQHMAY